ncbi:MAG: hypothetical protein DRI46_12045 [Chloroflexi bacterium]|nr:MAG: hypothetical protein DRI46_12045 [Chloroflexota bacterium]
MSITTTAQDLNNRQRFVLTALLAHKGRSGITISETIDSYGKELGFGTKAWPRKKADAKRIVRNSFYQLVEHGYLTYAKRARREGYVFKLVDRKKARAAIKN